MLVFPTIADIGRALPHVDPGLLGHDMAYPAMLTFLPAGVLGLMVAGLLAAYVSTISTHLNWGTSYLVHDLYRRFLRTDAAERHYVFAGRLVTAILMAAAGAFTLVLDTARETFDLLLSIGAGTGLLYLLRWYWWRVNAWSEIAAMASSFVLALGLFVARRNGMAFPAETTLVATVAVTTLVWIVVALATAPTDRARLIDFYTRVRPAGPGWAAIRRDAAGASAPDALEPAFGGWAAGCLLVYGLLFGSGAALFGDWTPALIWSMVAMAGAWTLARLGPRLWAR
jgi:Na+/proline symporter